MIGDDTLEGHLFIVGTGRCGTTLLAAMLSCHPLVHVPPETKFFRFFRPERVLGRCLEGPADAARWLEVCRASRFWDDVGLDEARLERDISLGDGGDGVVFAAMARQWAEQTGCRVLGEQTPSHWRTIDQILAAVPGARFVHMVRDPRDVALSARRIRMGHAHTGSIHRSCWAIAEALDAMDAARRRMGPEHVHELRYEDLVLDPERVLRDLTDWIGVPWDPVMLQYHELDQKAFSARVSGWQELTRSPLTADRIGRYRTRMPQREIRTVERVLGPRLERWGYDRFEDGQDRLRWWARDAASSVLATGRDRLRPLYHRVVGHARGEVRRADGVLPPP